VIRRRSGGADLTAVIVAGLGLALTGCSSTSKSPATTTAEADKHPEQVLADARAALRRASSVHVHGQVHQMGQASTVDLTIAPGKGASGTVTLGPTTLTLVKVGTATYVKGQAVPGVPAGKSGFTRLPDTQAVGLDAVLDLRALGDAALQPSGRLTRDVSRSTTAGVPSLLLTDAVDGSELFVVDGPDPRPLVAVTKGANSGTLTFDEYDKDVTFLTPAGAG